MAQKIDYQRTFILIQKVGEIDPLRILQNFNRHEVFCVRRVFPVKRRLILNRSASSSLSKVSHGNRGSHIKKYGLTGISKRRPVGYIRTLIIAYFIGHIKLQSDSVITKGWSMIPVTNFELCFFRYVRSVFYVLWR